MASEFTIDIQLTELGFSSWDFQVLKQKETHQDNADLDNASATMTSACPTPVDMLVQEETSVRHFTPVVHPISLPSHNGSQEFSTSSVHADSTETSTGDGDKTVHEEQSLCVREKRRKYPWYDENAEERLKGDKRKKLHKDQRKNAELKEGGAQRKLASDADVSEEEDENDNEEDDEEDDDNDDDNDSTEDEECDDGLSSDTNGWEEHRCEVCSLSFPTMFLLHEHLHVHNGVRLYRCAECGKQFCHLVNYRKHLRSHGQASTLQCVICTAQFATQDELKHHLDTNHFEEKFYQCDLCKRIFTSFVECEKHVQTHKRRAKRYPCPKCEHSFRHRRSMLYHLKRHKKGMFVCTDCGLAFSTKAVLLRHSFHHLGLLPYTCIRCKRHFRLSSLYMKHECKPEQLQCVACLVVFQSQEDFLKHKKDTGCWGHQTAPSSKTNDIRCMECGQVFDNSEELKKHAGMHQRILKCAECGMGFRSSIMLMSHMGGHVAQRPCLCKKCGVGFCHQQAYDSHLKTCGLVNPAEILLKKQKPNSSKKPVVTPTRREIRPLPQLAQSRPAVVLSGQTKATEGLTTFTSNKEPASSVPLVMLLPVQSSSASSAIQAPQKLHSDVSKRSLSAPQVVHIPLPLNNCSVQNEPDRTVLLKDMAGPVPSSNVLIPLPTVKNEKTAWTLLDGPCTSSSVTKIYTVIKQREQESNLKFKPVMQIVRLNAKTDQKKNILSNLEIAQVLSMMKKNNCDNKPKENLLTPPPTASDNAETTAGGEKPSGLRMENPSLGKSSDAQITANTERQSVSAVKMQPCCRGVDSSADMLVSSTVKRQTEEDQIPASVSSNPEERASKDNVHERDEPHEDNGLGLESTLVELGDEADIVQCETCGEMVLESDLVQHGMKH
ncbi:zinc finger protein 699 [Clarias gariepinus]|uniref:zinc finger protein 699 n=1 Tax=Clarias gariepinus TaxID=13013 RepID=UPI00234DC149|nr:zinc finger protein 699 [Clarias gariepinus]